MKTEPTISLTTSATIPTQTVDNTMTTVDQTLEPILTPSLKQARDEGSGTVGDTQETSMETTVPSTVHRSVHTERPPKELSRRSDQTQLPQNMVDDHIRQVVKSRFQKQDWAVGRGVVEEEIMRALEKRTVVHDFERARKEVAEPRERNVRPRVLDNVIMALSFGLSSAVILDFPYLCYRHGGITFFVPYLLTHLTFGICLCTIEIGLGQYYGRGTTLLFSAMNPTFTAMLFMNCVKMVYNVNDVTVSTLMFYDAAYSSFNNLNPWLRCEPDAETCYDYNYVAYCAQLKQSVLSGAIRPDVYKRAGCVALLSNKRNITNANQVTPVLLSRLQRRFWWMPADVRDFRSAEPDAVLVVMSVLVAGAVCSGVGLRRVTLFPLAALKTVGLLIVLGLYGYFYSTEHDNVGGEFFHNFEWKHVFDGQSWADAFNLCDGTLHRLGSKNRYDTRFWPTVAGLIIVLPTVSYLTAATFMMAIPHIAGVLYTVMDDVPNERTVHDYMSHGPIVTMTSIPESINADRWVVGWHLIPCFYFSIVAIGFPCLAMNIHLLYIGLRESRVYTFALGVGLRMYRIKRIVLLLVTIILLLPPALIAIQPWAKVLVGLCKHYAVNGMMIIAFVEVMLVTYAYDSVAFFVDIYAMHTKVVYPVLLIFMYGIVLSPLIVVAGVLYHFGLNQVCRIVDYVVPLRLQIVAGITTISVLGLIFCFVARQLIDHKLNHYNWRTVFRLEPSWIPSHQYFASLAKASRLAFRKQPGYSRVATAREVRKTEKN